MGFFNTTNQGSMVHRQEENSHHILPASVPPRQGKKGWGMGFTGNTKSGEGVRIGPWVQNFLAKRETVGGPKNCGLDAINGLQEKLLAQAIVGNLQD